MKKTLFFFLSIFFVSFSFAKNWDLDGINIITRQEWGADNKYLYKDFSAYKKIIQQNKDLDLKITKYPLKYKKIIEKRAIRAEREKYMLKNWKNQIKADKVVKYLNGKKLWWSFGYKFHKTDIIIHHTAADYKRFETKDKIEKYLRGVYYYHAIRRGWGDIGYNFIIDQFGNIYEGRAGGESVIGANSSWNNVSSIGIALVGNFNIEKPTQKQINSLIKLSTALSKKYNIDPYKQVYFHKEMKKKPYIQDVKNYSIVGHRDTGHTSCPGEHLYNMLDYIRLQVKKKLKKVKIVSYKKQTKNIYLGKKFSFGNKISIKLKNIKDLKQCKNSIQGLYVNCVRDTIILEYKDFFKFGTKEILVYGEKNNYKIKVYPIFMNGIRYLMKKKAEKYLGNKINKHKITKVRHKIYYSELKNIENKIINVLLYELSFFNHYEINCDKTCDIFTSKGSFSNIKSFKVDKLGKLLIWVNGKFVNSSYLKIIANNNGKIIFTNYKRKSYVGIPWNSFRGEILIKKDYFKEIGKKVKKQFVVINKLKFYNYIAGIAEGNDQMPFEKEKVMVLLVKTYILFYLDKGNIHPSIPKQSSYNAVDDPRIFQKYVGAGYEKTSKLWKQAVKQIKNKYLAYENYVPILPYFSCSKGFTISAKQKFGRIDTPYLTNNIDLGKCNKFYGHGVGLSGKGAEFLAKKGLTYDKIISWYFPGVKIISK